MPQIIQSVVSSGGKVLLQNITNLLGDAVVIGVAVAFKIDSILLIPLMSTGIAVSVFIGQNIGAGRPDRVKETVKYGVIMTAALSVTISLILWKFGYPLFTVFGLGREAAETGFRYILICLPFYWIFGLQFVLNGYLSGAKHTALTSGASLAGLGVRIIFAYACSNGLGADALPLAEALSWLTAVVIDIGGVLYFRRKKDASDNSISAI
jgi:Na+-driven multidrug efflux pump